MTTGDCRCDMGHEFSSAILGYDPSTNWIETADEFCPKCGADFVVTDMHYEDIYDY